MNGIFDTFFPKGDRLYRVHYHAAFAGDPLELSRVPAPIGPAMVENFPQVESVARFIPPQYQRARTQERPAI